MIRRIRREGSFERAITKALLEMLIKGIKVNVFYIPEGFIHFDDPERFRIDIYFADAPVGSWVSDPANFEHFTLL